MSRRKGARNRRFGSSGPSTPSVGFAITAVSQTAGKAAGGSVTTVTATGIVGTPTSTLGAVSVVTSTTFQITTNAHAAGAFSWTATSNGQTSASQTFTYLAAPTFASASPNNGPQTLTTAGVTMTGTNYPASGTGCPVTCTVDGNACTAVALVNSTTFTCTVPTDTTSGAKNVIVSVDGVAAATGTGAWTYNPPPVDISATNVSSNGGTGVITGLNFVTGATASVLINGTPTALTIVFVNSQKLTYTLPAGSYTAGLWALTVTNPDTQTDTETIFQIVSTSDPQTILGANLYAWYRADSGVTTSGALVTQWNDKGANALNLTASGSQRPTFNASSGSGFNAAPSITFDGVANALAVTSAVNLGSNTIFGYMAFRWVAASASAVAARCAGVGFLDIRTNAGVQLEGRYTVAGNTEAIVTAGSPGTSPLGVYAYAKGTGASTETVGANLGNMTEVTGAGAQTQPVSASPQSLVIGAAAAVGTSPANIEVVEAVFSNTLPSSGQLLSLYQYFNFRYGLDPAMSYSRSMNVLATTGTESRIAGAGFNSTTAVQVVISGTPTSVTSHYNSATAVSLASIPSLGVGAYDLIITNANSGQALIVTNALNVITTSQPDTIFGRKLIAWGRCDAVALNGSNISSFTDLACLGNVMAQVTAVNQPPLNASNSGFSNLPTSTWTGTPLTMLTGASVFDTGTTSTLIGVTYKLSSKAARRDVASFNTILRDDSGVGKPYGRLNGATPTVTSTWGTDVTGVKVTEYISETGTGANTENYAINVNFAGELTVSGTNANTVAGSVLQLAPAGSGNYFIGDIAEYILLDGIPSGAQFTAWQAYLARY